MKDIKTMDNKYYITMNERGVFVDGEPVTRYRNEEIEDVRKLPVYFSQTKREIKAAYGLDLAEIHALSSLTPVCYGKMGTPSLENGCYAWARVKLSDGRVSPWIGVIGFHFLPDGSCARHCAGECVRDASEDPVLRKALFRFARKPKTRKVKTEESISAKLKNIWSEFEYAVKSIVR